MIRWLAPYWCDAEQLKALPSQQLIRWLVSTAVSRIPSFDQEHLTGDLSHLTGDLSKEHS
jgi:hypothetical protein